MVFDVFLIWLKIIKTLLLALEKNLVLNLRYRKMNQKSYFTWTEDKKYTLAKLALRHEGYKLTDRNHQEKWETIIEKLKMKPEFAELEIQPMALKNQFSRMQKDVLKAAGISMEGANLSGLSEEPSELVTLLCNMAKEVHDKKIVGKEKKKKQKEKETAMNMTEKLALSQQGCSGGIKQEVTDSTTFGTRRSEESKNSDRRTNEAARRTNDGAS
jgi:hypothetical protein